MCPDEETRKDVGDMLKRVASALAAVDTFTDKMVELDEDAPDLSNKVGSLLERLTLTLMELYPNPRQFRADIESIGDFSVRTIEL